MVSDDENNQTATPDAFEILHLLAAKRLAARRLTVIDATNVKTEVREPLLALARKYHCLAVAIVFKVHHPQRRRAIFLGDLVDRGPKIPQVLHLVMDMVESGAALCLPGNHDVKLLGRLKGKSVEITHALAESLAQLEQETPGYRLRVTNIIENLVSHYILDDGRLVVAHAGMKKGLQGRDSRKVRDFALYGETTGESDELGLPARVNWATEYRGKAVVIYGHTPVPKPQWLNRTINVDTGCVFGGRLTALPYPEMD
jgi:protein phosphatase